MALLEKMLFITTDPAEREVTTLISRPSPVFPSMVLPVILRTAHALGNGLDGQRRHRIERIDHRVWTMHGLTGI